MRSTKRREKAPMQLPRALRRRIDVCGLEPQLARDPEKWEPVFGKDHAQN
jgi:hypothetical protein